MPNPTVHLSPQQIDFYRRQGYLIIDEPITTAQELEQLCDWYDAMFDRRAGRERGMQFDLAGPDDDETTAALPQILDPEAHEPRFADTLLKANAGAIGRQLLGEQAATGSAHTIYKPPRVGAATPWHQDASYWAADFEYRSASIWVPLQAATPENGCMHFVPRSHAARQVLTHQSIGNDPRVHGLELVESEMHHVQNVVSCPLPAGGATIHDGYTLHYAPPNHSEKPRRAYIFGASLPAVKLERPSKFPWLEARKTPRVERANQAAARQP